MRPVGRRPKLSQDKIKEMLDEYFNTDISLEEAGKKYGVSMQQVSYWVRKAKRGNIQWYQMKSVI